MFLVFGFRPILRTIGRGAFHCPREGVDRSYRRCSVRTYFTLFFVPLIPLKKSGELVRCESCGGRFELAVLELPTGPELSDQLVGATRHALAAVLRRLAPLTDPRRDAAVSVLQRHEQMADASWVDHDVTALDDAALEPYLPVLAKNLSAVGKEGFLSDLVWVAATDGSIDRSVRDLLEHIGTAMGMTPAHVRGIVAMVTEDRPR
jgi:hypothetical protein